ncbi:MAG: hypothetical protein A2V88_13220 [Elusimicrobia bacterium RBG_16_66_12]|nr:MAG: hypothetical protein A2V88_13220 [Elusimicrobia bacterium RBG_16_66_12]
MNEPIFIVGVPRSGTTLLAAMMGAHSRLGCGPETHFFRGLLEVDVDRLCRLDSWPGRAVDFLFSIRHVGRPVPENYGICRQSLETCLARKTPGVDSILSALTETYALSLGKSRWVEKTPYHLLCLSQIRRHFPDSPVVRIVRDPRDASLSLSRMPWGGVGFMGALCRWKDWDSRSSHFFGSDGRAYTLRYEDLLRSPETELRKLCGFIGERFEDSMRDTARSCLHVNRMDEPWKRMSGRPLDESRVYAWRRHLSKTQNRMAEALLWERLKAYGYPVLGGSDGLRRRVYGVALTAWARVQKALQARPGGTLWVVWGGVGRGGDGAWLAKNVLASHIHGLATYFDECVWMAWPSERDPTMSVRVDPGAVRVIPLARGRLGSLANLLKAAILCRRRPYALLEMREALVLAPIMPLIKLLSRRTAVYAAYDYELAVEQGWDGWRGWVRILRDSPWLLRLLHQCVLGSADVVIARGRRLARLAKRVNARVHVSSPVSILAAGGAGPRADRRADAADESRRIIFAGRLERGKGLDVLLVAFRDMLKKHPGTSIILDIAGDGPQRSVLEEQVREIGLGGNVVFRGWLESEDALSSFFDRADVLVVPTSTHPEGLPRVIEEALACGVPVVATRVGGIPCEFDGDEVLLVNPGDSRPLAEAMGSILFDPPTRQRYLSGARRYGDSRRRRPSSIEQHALILRGDEERSLTCRGSSAPRRGAG